MKRAADILAAFRSVLITIAHGSGIRYDWASMFQSKSGPFDSISAIPVNRFATYL
jgi:hypothetical protein